MIFRAEEPGPTMQHDDNLRADLPNFMTHLGVRDDGERHEADQVHNLSRAGNRCWCDTISVAFRKALSKEASPRARLICALSRIAACSQS
jgi:hypothetical protein